MINKIEVEILAVGQGSCNVVKGIDTAQNNKIEYLAILDAGGGNTSSSPVKEAIEKLMDYMKKRATDAGTKVQTNHYADLLLLSHSDQDHNSIIKYILGEIDPNILDNEASKKVTVVPRKISAGGAFESSDDGEEDEDFAQASYSMNLITSGLLTGFLYTYCFQTDLCEGLDLYLLRTFNEVTAPVYSELLICGDKRVECAQIGADIFSINFNQWFSFTADTSTFWWRTLNVKNNDPYISVAIEYYDHPPGVFTPTSGLTPRYYVINEMKTIFTTITPDAIGILKFLCNIAGADFIINVIKDFCKDIAQTLTTISNMYGASYYSPMTKDSIKAIFNPASEYSTPTGNTLSFGETVTSLSSEKIRIKVTDKENKEDEEDKKVRFKLVPTEFLPAEVGALAMKADKHIRLRGSCEWLIPSDTAPVMKITMIGVPEDSPVRFYIREYPKTATSHPSDSMFRNVNSIITIIEVSNIGPHFIFPGDATVHNLWYNKENDTNSSLLKGNGNNFFVLPHHGASLTSSGSETPKSPDSVFLSFLKLVDSQHMYISCGRDNTHGHPNAWTMLECKKYIDGRDPQLPSVPGNVVYFNYANNKTKDYAYCKYPWPLYTTISAKLKNIAGTEKYEVVTPSYRITFEPGKAEHSILDCISLDCEVPSDIITSSFERGDASDTKSELPVNLSIYEFNYKD